MGGMEEIKIERCVSKIVKKKYWEKKKKPPPTDVAVRRPKTF